MIESILIFAALAVPPGARGAVTVELELASQEVRMLDPVFARVTVTNGTPRMAKLSTDAFQTVQYSLSAIVAAPPTWYRCEYSYFQMHCRSGGASRIPLATGEERILDYEILELPPIGELRNPVMQRIVYPGAQPALSVQVFTDEFNTPVEIAGDVEVWVRDRPQAEMAFLSGLFGEDLRRREAREDPKGRPVLDWGPVYFGLASLEFTHPDLVRKLIAYEEQLSPGSLRDIVHLLRLTEIIARSEDADERKGTVEDVLEWLDTLPEIERHCLAMKIVSWVSGIAPGEPARYYELVCGSVERLPKRLYQFEDYHAYQLNSYGGGHPGFNEYLTERKRPDSDRPMPLQGRPRQPQEAKPPAQSSPDPLAPK